MQGIELIMTVMMGLRLNPIFFDYLLDLLLGFKGTLPALGQVCC
jgi:hypothetical protein